MTGLQGLLCCAGGDTDRVRQQHRQMRHSCKTTREGGHGDVGQPPLTCLGRLSCRPIRGCRIGDGDRLALICVGRSAAVDAHAPSLHPTVLVGTRKSLRAWIRRWWMHHFQMPSRVETWAPSKNNPTKGPTSAPSYVRVSTIPVPMLPSTNGKTSSRRGSVVRGPVTGARSVAVTLLPTRECYDRTRGALTARLPRQICTRWMR